MPRYINKKAIIAAMGCFIVLGALLSFLSPFEKLNYDVGNVCVNSTNRQDVKVTNHGLVPLRVQATYSSCSCTQISPSDTLLMPFSSRYLTLTVSPTGIGRISTKVMFVVSGISSHEYLFGVSGNAETDYEYSPGAVDFGDLEVGKAATANISITPLTEKAQRSHLSIRSNDYLSLKVRAGDVASTVVIEIGLHPSNLSGPFSTLLQLDDELGGEIQIPVSARFVGPAFAQPETLYLGRIRRGLSVEAPGVIKWQENDRSFKDNLVAWCDSPSLSVLVGPDGTFKVVAHGEGAPHRFESNVFISNVQRSFIIRIPVFGVVQD